VFRNFNQRDSIFSVVSSSQQHTTDHSLQANGADATSAATGTNESPVDQGVNLVSSENRLAKRHSLTVADLAALGASSKTQLVLFALNSMLMQFLSSTTPTPSAEKL